MLLAECFWAGREALSMQLTRLQSEAHSTCSKAHSDINSPRIGDVLSTREEQSNSLWAQGQEVIREGFTE